MLRQLSSLFRLAVFAVIGLVSTLGYAESYETYIKEHQLVQIEDYDKQKKLYEVVDIEFSGQGPIYASPEDLAASIGALSLEKIKREPASIIKTQYVLDKKLSVEWLDE